MVSCLVIQNHVEISITIILAKCSQFDFLLRNWFWLEVILGTFFDQLAFRIKTAKHKLYHFKVNFNQNQFCQYLPKRLEGKMEIILERIFVLFKWDSHLLPSTLIKKFIFYFHPLNQTHHKRWWCKDSGFSWPKTCTPKPP